MSVRGKSPRKTRSAAAPHGARGEEKRALILQSALSLFRRQGFDATTMREVAAEAGVALGGAYHYFPSKEAIVLSYYEETQRLSRAAAMKVFATSDDIRERLGAVFVSKLDVLAKDGKLLSGLFRSIADPQSDASIFGPATHDVREDSIALIAEALRTEYAYETLEPGAQRLVQLALWSLQMGMLLFFIHDTSPKHQKTRRLVNGALDMVCELLPMAPMLAPVLGARIGALLADAGLVDVQEERGAT